MLILFRMSVRGPPSTGVDQGPTLEGQDAGPSTAREEPVTGGTPRYTHSELTSDAAAKLNRNSTPSSERKLSAKNAAAASEVKKKKGSVSELIARQLS